MELPDVTDIARSLATRLGPSAARGYPDVRMTAISRHGLLPQPHENPTHQSASKFDATALLGRGPLSERLRRFRAQVVASGGDWRAALQQVREVMPALWRAAPRRLRRRSSAQWRGRCRGCRRPHAPACR